MLELLTAKFGPISENDSARVHAASPAEVSTWATRVLTVTTLADVFAPVPPAPPPRSAE